MLHRNIEIDTAMISYHLLLAHDAADLTAHLLRLAPQERATRFFTAVNDHFIETHVAGIDWRNTVVIAAFKGGHIVGAAELFATDYGAELAVTVDHDIQREGIGTELVRRALLAARNRGISHVHVEYLSHNLAIRHVAAKFAPALHFTRGGAVADIPVAAPDPVSLAREVAAEASGWFWDFTDRWQPYAPPR
jgi:GNAT superfamily N-acetyltransferase